MKKRKQKRLLFLTVLLMAIGFASITTTLVLNGTLNLLGDVESFAGDVIFTKAKTEAGGLASIIKEGKEITFTSKELSKVNESTTLNFDITNKNRQYDAVASINCNTNVGDYAEYISITPNKTEYEISAGGTVSGHLTATLIKSYDQEEGTDIAFTCTLNVEAREREKIGEEYIPVEPFSKAGTMMAAETDDVGLIVVHLGGKFWQYSEYIEKIVFEDVLSPHETDEEYIFDVSVEQDGSVMSYLLPISYDNMGRPNNFILYIQSETGVKANNNCLALFASFSSLKTIEGLEYFDTSNVTNMGAMFWRCFSLTNLEGIESWNTSNTTAMFNMFFQCYSLTNLDISNWDVSNLTDIDQMFSECSSLISLNISNIDFTNIHSSSSAFFNMPDNAKIIVKDEKSRQWILNLSSGDRPSAWTTDNIIIKG